MPVIYDPTTLPVLYDVGVAIVGGSLAGIGAALGLRRAGRSVVVIESRTYLGREMTATLRPWLTVPAGRDAASLPGPIRAILAGEGSCAAWQEGEIPLRPDAIKRSLEDALLGAGVDLVYASLPVALVPAAGGRMHLVIGNKSGRQIVRCDSVVDTTETGLVARLTGGEFEPGEKITRFTRTLEFDRAEPIMARTLPVLDHLGIAGDAVRLHAGYRGSQHLLVECDLDLPYEPGLDGATAVEFAGRERMIRLAAWLMETRAELGQSRFAGGSHELRGRWTPSLAGAPPAWSSWAEDVALDSPDGGGGRSLPLRAIAGPAAGLWCLNTAARLDADQTRWLLDPIGASRLGEALADALINAPIAHAATPTISVAASTSEHASDVEIREPVSPQRGRAFERQQVPALPIAVTRTCDVLVAGGGTSGATAAITASKEGVRTALLDMNPGPGGTGTYGGVDSYWYGRHEGFAARLEEEVHEAHASLHHTGGKWNIEAKTFILLRMLHNAGAETIFNAIAIGALTRGDRVRGAVAATRWGPLAVLADVTVDATGDGDIAAFAGAPFIYGADRTHDVMWYSLAQYATPGLIRNNFTSTVDVSNIEDVTRAILAGRRRGDATHDHGIYVATRESRHVRGEAVLTMTDQLRHRQWPDVVNIHYSNHDIKGQSTSPWVRSGLIPPNLEIEIPYRLLLPRGLDGILIVGKAFSVTHDALPAVRMQADLENLGGVAGLAAAQTVKEGTSPRAIDLHRLQRRLVSEGILPETVLTRDIGCRRRTDAELRTLIDELTGEEPLYTYSDMQMGEIFAGQIPFVEIVSAGERAVPLLETALTGANGKRRVVLAQALALLGAHTAVPVLIAAIEDALSSDVLPARDSSIRHAGYPPDQGAMPDVVYLLFSLGMVPDRRALPIWEHVAALLHPTTENLRDRFSGTFSYVDALCHAAERAGDPAMIPPLQRVHDHPAVRDQVCPRGFQSDYFQERQAMLELALARGLARCGGGDGYRLLIAYLDDVRALLAEAAHSELIALTGVDRGKDAAAWTGWLAAHPPEPRPLDAIDRPT